MYLTRRLRQRYVVSLLQTIVGDNMPTRKAATLTTFTLYRLNFHDDVVTRKNLRYLPFVMRIQRLTMESHHKGPLMQCFDIFFVAIPKKPLKKQSIWDAFKLIQHHSYITSHIYNAWKPTTGLQCAVIICSTHGLSAAAKNKLLEELWQSNK